MAGYWSDRAPDARHLRLFVAGQGWSAYTDKTGDDGQAIEAHGSRTQIESAFLNALNATHLLVLTGAGASFCAKNPTGKPQAPGMADLWKAVREAVGEKAFTAICKQFPKVTIGDNIEKLLSLCKIYLELHETVGESDDAAKGRTVQFVREAERTILACVNFVAPETSLDAHSNLVRKIGRRGVRKPRAKLFTTNYDLCFEEAARRHRFTVIDGFSHSLDQVYDRSHFDYDIVRRDGAKEAPDYIANVFHLYKLHGSLDWRRINGEIVRSMGDQGEPVLIYPRSSKYQEAFDPPYLDMLGAFQSALREPDTALIVSGFGFNDDHISRPIWAAMEANMSLRLIICDPVFIPSGRALETGEQMIPDDPSGRNNFLSRFHKLASGGDPRIHLINGRFADMAVALPDLVGETDRERHIARVRSLRDEATL